MAYDWALKTICILHRVVAMIPRRPVLRRIEDVAEAIPWRNWTLSYAVDTIHVHRLVLSNTMPVNTRAVPLHTIDHRDIEGLHNS